MLELAWVLMSAFLMRRRFSSWFEIWVPQVSEAFVCLQAIPSRSQSITDLDAGEGTQGGVMISDLLGASDKREPHKAPKSLDECSVFRVLVLDFAACS